MIPASCPMCCGPVDDDGMTLAASAIEARRAETQGGSVADESAGPEDDAHA
jgi:hypothetical protein